MVYSHHNGRGSRARPWFSQDFFNLAEQSLNMDATQKELNAVLYFSEEDGDIFMTAKVKRPMVCSLPQTLVTRVSLPPGPGFLSL